MTMNRQRLFMKKLRKKKSIFLIFLGAIFFESPSLAQDRIANLEWQLQQNNTRINDASSHIKEAINNLNAHRSVQSDLRADLQSCNKNRFIRRFACRRRVRRRLSETQETITYWDRVLHDRQNRLKNFISVGRRLNAELQSERLLAQYCQRKQNHNIINEILNAEQMKIAQEVDYDSVENGRCNPQNSWLQDQLDVPGDTQDFNQSLDPRCTYRALKEFSNCGGKRQDGCFVKCESYSGDPEFTKTAPCVSRRLHHSIHQAITEVSSCLQLDPKTLFSLFLNESGVNPSVRSHSDATGMGQITETFIEEINKSFDLYKDEILPALSRNPLRRQSCRSVRDKISAFGKIPKDLSSQCSRTNHYTNTFYSAIDHLQRRSEIGQKMLKVRGKETASIPENSSFRHALESDISSKTRELFENLARLEHLDSNDHKIITELSFYSHNLPKTITIFQNYLDDPNEGHLDTFTGPQGQWLSYLKRNKVLIDTDEKRQNEILKYIYGDSSGGGYRVRSRSFMKGQMDRIEIENKTENREKIYCRPY